MQEGISERLQSPCETQQAPDRYGGCVWSCDHHVSPQDECVTTLNVVDHCETLLSTLERTCLQVRLFSLTILEMFNLSSSLFLSETLATSYEHAEAADLCLAMGSSLTVTPAAEIPEVRFHTEDYNSPPLL